jgi:hypothetical protein
LRITNLSFSSATNGARKALFYAKYTAYDKDRNCSDYKWDDDGTSQSDMFIFPRGFLVIRMGDLIMKMGLATTAVGLVYRTLL